LDEITCGLTPAVCSNQGCGVTVNKRDLIHHESEVCEFRKLKCHSCGEMTKTLADMEKNCKPGEEYGDEDNNVNGNKNGEC
jgi:hypothetical protein